MTMKDRIARDIASAVAWLDLAQVQELARLLLADDTTTAARRLGAWVPELDDLDLADPGAAEALLDELEWRLSPPDEDDPDAIATREVPDYTRFAHHVE
jgi:hypothetical protein